MRFSACCTTRSKVYFAVAGSALLGAALAAPAQSSALPGVGGGGSAAQAVVQANWLTKPSASPFHLKLSFDVFDLKGKPLEKGTLERWWTSNDGTHLEIKSPSVGTQTSLNWTDAPGDGAARTLMLVGQLLDAVVNPGAALGASSAEVVTETRHFGAAELECMHPVALPKYPGPTTQVCYDGATQTIRLVDSPNHSIVRNTPAKFGSSRLGMAIAVSWIGRMAIQGHVDVLESFDVKTSKVALEGATQSHPAEDHVRLRSGVLAGQKIGGEAPHYPEAARLNRVQGAVILMGRITKEGRIERLVPLASPDPSLTEAAITAVKTWTYRPYLLDGEPTEVTTDITVNFNLSR